MIRSCIYPVLLSLLCLAGYSQEIRLDHKLKPEKSRTIRLDKPVMVKTFDGVKSKGMLTILDNEKLILDGKDIIALDRIMMISGYVIRDSREKALGLGLTIGAGVVLPAALYYFLGGIAWGLPNGIFVTMTILVFDLLLAYAGTNVMGVYPRRFSTMNWEIALSPAATRIPNPLPQPS
ncbi:hypothetical protein KA005_15655, partial [bacterium]|nr:hypothetical protein [bacterium]